MGRPSAYSKPIEDEVVRRMIAGESLLNISQSAHLPSYATMMRWKSDPDHEFRANYARAREDRGITYGEKVAEIAFSVLTGKVSPEAGRVAMDGLKWSAARMNPREFGDKIELTGEVDINVGVLAVPMKTGSLEEWKKSDPTREIVAESPVVEADPKAQPMGVVRA